jgi:drug/metabolite transporter (DMT)-like permease
MTVAFNIALNILLIGSVLTFLAVIIGQTIREPDPRERGLRLMALAVGAMISVGAQASGADYATYTVKALAGARPASAGAQVATTIIPGLLGGGLGFYLVRTFKKNERRANRIMSLIAMLSATAFAAVYAQAANLRGIELGKAALANIAFVAGVILAVIFTFDQDREGAGGANMAAIAQILRKRNAQEPRSSRLGTLFGRVDEPDGRPKRVDPFSQ